MITTTDKAVRSEKEQAFRTIMICLSPMGLSA